MRVSGWQYLWGTLVSLTLFCMTEWWLLKMLWISVASILAIAYSVTNEDEEE